MTKETIRVVLCGDPGVGKSSLIASLAKGKFVEDSEGKFGPVVIPKDFSASPYSPKNTILIDTSDNDTDELYKELKIADVIWLCYCDKESYERISLYWMVTFRSLGLNLPVIVSRTKCDDYEDSTVTTSPYDTKVEDEEFIPILIDFKEVDNCIKVSAKTQFNINQAFYLCQRSIIYPISPLFDSRLGEFKPQTVSALKRIFLLSDYDQDGYLSDRELSNLQKKCFKKSIDINEMQFIKQTFMTLSNSQLAESHTELYVTGKGITEEGFLFLNKLYVEKGRHETIWGILRAFYYTDSLSIKVEVLYPKLNIPATSSVELSPIGYRFLVNLFLKYDTDNDGGLTQDDLNKLFKCTPGIPHLWLATNFPYSTVVNGRGCITLQGWLAQWSMTTFLDYKITTAYLVYFDFQEDAKIALQITKPRKFRWRNGKYYRSTVNDRKVFNCLLIGKSNCGKTSLLESFLGRPYSEAHLASVIPHICVNSLELKGSKQYYLILQETGVEELAMLENKDKLKNSDVICLMYDSSDPDSFSYLVELFEKYKEQFESLPVILVASKADLDKQQQRCHIQPDLFAETLFIDHPLHISCNWINSLNELLIKITETALVPIKAIPGLPEEASYSEEDYKQASILLASSVGFISLVTFAYIKWQHYYKHS
ncbi:hypothetical protein TPHA_0H02990 [Tetrapisispora phaffii CBS 4417]|uniref:Mitochondrial Rho GTPase n=1 Tax=Tetrapisispora phaffii (strain ATCC 24235 / CBS 4417 / NBRC 1672 / NRRL Y-8282 / UCD 70-5) TaxID=1071381 RepID=G8BWQ1_TETPH|nr:hypothetical protein TPHA_0H02990 [Tetrapisispora phaffii CBS 4417]CCE64502.1 hypothetical protein TPHA_0H02990 [Tetrapisispora phaffii CBS 4417]